MNTENQEDGFFSERSYDAANQLAGVIGPIFEALFAKREPNWVAANNEITSREMLSLIFGENRPDYIVARLEGFSLLTPLVRGKVKDPLAWLACIENICDVFPAYYAAILGDDPNTPKAEAETAAYLRYSGKRNAA